MKLDTTSDAFGRMNFFGLKFESIAIWYSVSRWRRIYLYIPTWLHSRTYLCCVRTDACAMCIKFKLLLRLFAWAMYASSRCCMHVNIFRMVHFSVFKTSNRYFHGSIRSQQDPNIQEEQKKKNNACENEHMVSLGVFPPAFVYLLSCNRFDPVATRFSSSGCLFPFEFTLKLDLLFVSNGTLRTEYRCKEYAYSS